MHFVKEVPREIYTIFLQSKSTSEDEARREFILNILLIGIILLLTILFVPIVTTKIELGSQYTGIPLLTFSIIWLFFAALFAASRFSYFRIVSYIFIGVYFVATTWGAWQWGPDVPAILLSYSLLTIMAVILIGSLFGSMLALGSVLIIIVLGYMQVYGLYTPFLDWKNQPLRLNDLVTFAAILLCSLLVSWLYNREIERSLRRARASEAALKQERDLLEVKVEERTREIKQIQMERLSQVYHLAEFGRVSSGLFHDLINPLTAVMLNAKQLKDIDAREVAKAQGALARTLSATERMQGFIDALRRQLTHGAAQVKVPFLLNEEIEKAITVLSHKARISSVEIVFRTQAALQFEGDPIKFYQVATNLISNALDAYEGISEGNQPRQVKVKLEAEGNSIRLTVQDFAGGIPAQHLEKIFEPFFTTKPVDKGTGIGLSSTMHVVEQTFNGTIRVESELGKGSIFIVEFPR